MAKETEMIICKRCNIKAELVTGEYIYPFNNRYKKNNYYICKICGDYVGCHRGTTIALGTLAGEELRKKRVQVHKAFDILWSDLATRKQAYINLAKKLNISLSKCHIAAFDDNLCKKALKIIKKWRQNG